jgi:cell division protein FtsW (lipid II flippase)
VLADGAASESRDEEKEQSMLILVFCLLCLVMAIVLWSRDLPSTLVQLGMAVLAFVILVWGMDILHAVSFPPLDPASDNTPRPSESGAVPEVRP